LSDKQSAAVLNAMRRRASTAAGTPVHDGTYTVVMGDVRRTVRLRTQRDDARFAPGRQVASYLFGSDNVRDYKAFAFVTRDGQLHLWRRAAANAPSALVEAMATILGDPSAAARNFGLMSGVCGICNRKLTVPESIEAGIGPVCARKRGW